MTGPWDRNFEYREFPFTNFAFPDKPNYVDDIERRIQFSFPRRYPMGLEEVNEELRINHLKLTDEDLLFFLERLKEKGKFEFSDGQWRRI